MAAPSGLSLDPPQPPTTTEVCQWLKNLPLAPEYRPTLSEFQDPIAYIFKIEKEASQYGICKIIPPVLPSAKKTTLSNLNRSLCARNGGSSAPTFTTRQQQIGFCPRKPRPVQKPVWQSGETYTFQEFETKARTFEKNYLKKFSKRGALSPLEIETLYWKATLDKPFSVEYANDMPGSAFSPRKKEGQGGVAGEGMSVGETEWNMRGVSRAKGSLLRFMKEEIPGVTSPMVYIGMMFSWFAWHVEDHDLHSLNYMHMGAGKTWYGVPREAAVAFEEVVRVHGYGGEINPLVTFAVLGEKTTVMSPEVFISAGVPCCRLVQNAGEFVVTFPRAYHSGFSHGFNCGEAANIATPEWLMVAKDAAIRRASINYPPMVSHFQLLYDLALEFCTRIPVNISAKPRSSRLKDKQKGEGEMLVKEQFVKNMIQNNDLLHILGKGSSVVLLPRGSSDISVCSKLRVGSQLRDNPTLGLCSQKDVMKSSKSSGSGDILQDKNQEINQVKGFFSVKAKFASLCERNRFSTLNGNECSQSMNIGTERGRSIHGDKLSDQRLFSCVTCGILSFDCLAIIQPKEAASRYLMSADCSFFNDWAVGSGVTRDVFSVAGGIANISEQNSSRWVEKNTTAGFYDVPVQSPNYQIQMADQGVEVASSSAKQLEASALGLLALNYGNSSDSEEDLVEADLSHHDEINMTNCSLENKYQCQSSAFPSYKQKYYNAATGGLPQSPSRLGERDDVPLKANDMYPEHGDRRDNFKDKTDDTLECSFGFPTGNPASIESNSLDGRYRDPMSMSHVSLNCSPIVHDIEKTKFNRPIAPIENPDMPFTQRSDKDSSCMHVFCLEHAVEIEQQLRQIGGVHISLLCHPEYPRIEGEAKLVSEELGIDHLWNDITFRDAAKEDEERIQSALDSEEAIPGSGDWAVKLGINLFFSANLSRSPFYSKQMPYNFVIYNAFGLASSVSSTPKFKVYGRRSGKPKKVVAGKWCGKVWMSNQVHPFLVIRDRVDQDHEQEQERSFHASATPDEKLEKKPQTSNKTETTRKSGRKRKITAGSRSIKKVKCLEVEEPDSEDSMGDNCHRQHVRVHNSKNIEDTEREISYDLVPDSHQQHGRCSRKWAKSVESDDAVSDDPLAEHVRQQYRRMRRSKQAKSIKRENTVSYASVENKFQKQLKRAHRSDRAKFFERQSAASDNSLDDNSDQWHERAPRSTQAKYTESEDAFSDDSPEESSRWLHGRVPKSKQLKYIDKEGAISDDSLESGSHQHNRRVSRGKRAQLIKRNDVVSDDSLDESAYQRLPRFSRSKLAKLIERENAVSDDSLDNNIHQHHGRVLKSKQAKFVEGEDAISDDSHEDNTDWQRKRIPRSKMAKFVESEDAASDDLQEDDTHQHRRRIPKSKKTNFIEREVVISDDLWENNTHRHPRKAPRSKQARFIEREDLVSDDLLEDNSDQQEKRILRSKQKKSATLCQIKQGTPRKPKHIAPRMIKKETLKSIKQERQIKQETPQQRIGKSELNARQFDSHSEEGVEGGPSTRLRKRPSKPPKQLETKLKEKQQNSRKKLKDASAVKAPVGRKNVKVKDEEAEFQCDIDGCTMSFGSKQELAMHKRNICPVKGCGKKFFSHKYLVQHRRVHIDDRPLKCPWKGCKMTFKWAWARTEHIRVHTGARPYVCAEEGCGQTFRFVSDFSRHKRKTGHSAKKSRG